jgi:hypothetical protein
LIIPIGGKSVSAADETFTSRMVKLIDDLEKEYYRNHKTDKGLKELYLSLRNLLGNAQIGLTNQNPDPPSSKPALRSYLSLRKTFSDEFLKATRNDFGNLLSFKPPELGYIQGSLLIVPLKDKSVEENYSMRLALDLQKWSKDADMLHRMYAMSNSPDYIDELRSAIREALDLIGLLQQKPENSQRLNQSSERNDQYYAIPLFCLISAEVLENYFATNPEEPEETFFKKLLFNYVRTLYPIEGLLPIGSNYREFPFILFKSYDLRQARSKTFTEKYIMTSRELNVLNLILSEEKSEG